MHKCVNCGKEFEGKFCPQCGTKWVDPDSCPKCGAHHDADAKFCQECGARLDGKVACPGCGAVMDGGAAYCSQCGSPVGNAGAANGGVLQGKVRSAAALCGVVCLVLSALMGLVFAFVSGVSLINTDSGKVIETNMLYVFFGEAYEDADTVLNNLKETLDGGFIGAQREFAVYFPIIVGTVVCAVGLLGVTVLFGLTVFNAYRKYCKNRRANVAVPAVATYLVFATMVTLLLMLVASETDAGDFSVYSSSALVSKAVFSAPTLAGLIAGGVLLGIGVLLTAVANSDAFKGFNSSVGAIFAVVVCALTVVITGLVSMPSVGLEIDLSKIGFDYSAKASFGLFMGMDAILAFIENDDTFTKVVSYLAVGGGAAVLLAVVSAVILSIKIPALSKGKNGGTLILGAIAVALAVLYLTFSILSANAIADALVELADVDGEVEDSIRETIRVSYSVPIATLVISVLAFAAEVAGKFIRINEMVAVPAQAE